MKINTVRGAVNPGQLGLTLMHEHIWNVNHSMMKAFGDSWVNREQLIEVASELFSDVREKHGVKTIVDMTVINIGRDIDVIQEVARRADINMVVSTGFFHTEEPALADKKSETIVELLMKEWVNGIQGTGIKPGAIKGAVGMNGFTPMVVMLLDAYSQVCKKTNLPLCIHTEHRTCPGREVLDILEKNGVDPGRTMICHAGDVNDITYLEDLLKRGAYLGLDRFSQDWENPLEDRINTLLTLVNHGFIDRLIVSHDLAVLFDFPDRKLWLNSDRLGDLPEGRLDLDYNYLFDIVFPELKKRGMSQKEIDRIMIQNALECLSGEESTADWQPDHF